MFKLTHPLPDKVLVAVSGGLDSMAALHWLREGKKVLGIIHINHRTGVFADDAQLLVSNYCWQYDIPLHLHKYPLPVGIAPKKATEEDWRDFRYQAFHSYGDLPVVTAHHTDDCLEEYLSCVLKRGYMGTIPYKNKNVIRPFRNWRKKLIREYVDKWNDVDAKNNKEPRIKWLEDPSNMDTSYLRNEIRHELVPKVLEVNPGIYSLVEKAIAIQDDFDARGIPVENRFTKL